MERDHYRKRERSHDRISPFWSNFAVADPKDESSPIIFSMLSSSYYTTTSKLQRAVWEEKCHHCLSPCGRNRARGFQLQWDDESPFFTTTCSSSLHPSEEEQPSVFVAARSLLSCFAQSVTLCWLLDSPLPPCSLL